MPKQKDTLLIQIHEQNTLIIMRFISYVTSKFICKLIPQLANVDGGQTNLLLRRNMYH